MPHIEGNIAGKGLCRVDFSRGRITSVKQLEPLRDGEPFLSPGFVDTQLNGFAGVDFSSPDLGPDDLDPLLHALWKTGTTSFCPTLISNSPDGLLEGFRNLERARKAHPRFAACAPLYHLEGPFLSPGPSSGAHKPEFMRNPDWEAFERLLEASGNRIRILTLAPEWPAAEAFTRQAVRNGIRVSLSHTDGCPADVHRLAAAGARLSTHLGNGCPQALDRHKAPFWAQLDDDRLAAGLICDGFHLSPEMIRIILRVKGLQKCLLVSDAVFVAGLQPGPYELLGKPIELLPSGQVVTASRSSMAGSTLDMANAIRHFMEVTGLGLTEALLPATSVPARFLDHPDIPPAILPGQPANFVRLTFTGSHLSVESTFLAGECVFRASGSH